jgi:hypothetical protein
MRENQNAFLRSLFLPMRKLAEQTGFDATLAKAIRKKAGRLTTSRPNLPFSELWRRARRKVQREWMVFPSHPCLVTNEHLQNSELVICPAYLSRKHVRALPGADTFAPKWALASLLPIPKQMRTRTILERMARTMFTRTDGQFGVIDGSRRNTLNFALDVAASWRPKKTQWKTDFFIHAGPAITALTELGFARSEAIKFVRAWQLRSARSGTAHNLTASMVNRAFMMKSRVL